MPVNHPYVFFGKISIQIFCPFSDWVVFLISSCISCLHILDNPLLVTLFANIFSWSIGCLFVLFMVSFAVQKLISLIRSHLFIFVFISIALCWRVFCLCLPLRVLYFLVLQLGLYSTLSLFLCMVL